MGLRNTSAEWGSLARALHWVIAIGIFALLYLGWMQSDLPRGDEKTAIRFIHASIALAVLALMLLRVAWRWMNETPASPAGMPAAQKAVSTLVHLGLYVAIFVQLVSGAMTVATNGTPLPFFDLFSVPLPVAENHDAHEFWEEIHEPAWYALVALIGLHVLGALYNHFVAKNDILRRMTHGA